MLMDDEKNPLRKRSFRPTLLTALISYNYEKAHPDYNFSKWVSLAITKTYGPEYATKRGLPKRVLKLFSRLKESKAA